MLISVQVNGNNVNLVTSERKHGARGGGQFLFK